MQNQQKSWYKEWFNTTYYHKLYKHRGDNEARTFIDNILEHIQPPEHWHFLDLACGRGRHAVYLHNKGYNVTGIDLSPRNIEYARQYQKPGLSFDTADMRQPYGENKYDVILNLFTSFGYFDSVSDSYQSCCQIKKALKPGGILLLDFMNVHKVQLGLVEQEVRKAGGIEFCLERSIRDNKVIKTIKFEDEGKQHEYEEKVQLLGLSDFEELFSRAGLQIERVFGDYDLQPFDDRTSERLIIKASA